MKAITAKAAFSESASTETNDNATPAKPASAAPVESPKNGCIVHPIYGWRNGKWVRVGTGC